VAYIGTAPTAGQYRKLDSISSSFNGSTTTFTMQVGGQNVSAGTPAQLLISLGGVIQQPTTDYTVSTNSLTFVTAPASGLSFFAILMGDALSVGTPADGSVSTAKLATGLTVDLTSGSAAAPSLTFDANTGLYSPAEDTIGFVEGGVEAARIDSSGRLLVGTSSSRDVASAGPSIVQIEGSSFRHLSMVQNSNDDNGVTLAFGKSRGTSAGGTTIVQNNDDIARLRFAGANGSDVATVAAEIQCQIDGTPGVSNDMPGRLTFSTTPDSGSNPLNRLIIKNDGYVICQEQGQAEAFNLFSPANQCVVYVMSQANFSTANTGMRIGRNSGTGRSINAGGTVNASGADYAEYMVKTGDFTIAKSDICGVTADGLLTPSYVDAVSFVVKSTNPSYVGGDTWGSEDAIGPKPDADDADALAQWEVDFETARQKVDRIAFAGQVPINVTGATPGQYIVPVQSVDGGIEGVAKDEANLTLSEYMRAVGKVIAIEDDGRARIIVKVA